MAISIENVQIETFEDNVRFLAQQNLLAQLHNV